jgi:hypothetical protein
MMMIATSKKNLMLGDALFVLAFAMIVNTRGLTEYPIILSPPLVIAFASCIIRHINYYKLTKKIY